MGSLFNGYCLLVAGSGRLRHDPAASGTIRQEPIHIAAVVHICYGSIMPNYGRVFESMFRGSLFGESALTWIVWVYVIANMQPKGPKRKGLIQECYVDLNPYALAPMFKSKPEQVGEVIRALNEPDSMSSDMIRKAEDDGEIDGRRLIPVHSITLSPLGDELEDYMRPVMYHVVNGSHYRSLRSSEDK